MLALFHDLGYRIAIATDEPRYFKLLTQRVSVAIQRGNASCITGTVPSSADWDEYITFSNKIAIQSLLYILMELKRVNI